MALRKRAGGLGRVAGRAFAVLGLIVLVGSLAPAVAGATGGNDGTVKIDNAEVQSGSEEANEPHLGCGFNVEWWGFDEGDQNADVTFTNQPPTGSGETLLHDNFDFTGSGDASHLDASQFYDLTDALKNIPPQANQGWHVEATIDTTSSNGSDVKHKTFWVSGCQPTEPPPADTGSITLDKVLAGDAAPQDDPSFGFSVACDDSGATFPQGATFTLKASDAVMTVADNVALDTTCTITETDSHSATGTSFSVDGGAAQDGPSVEVTPESTTAVAVVATNTFTATVLGTQTTSEPTTTVPVQETQVLGEELARTGFNSTLWALVGCALLLGGSLLTRYSKRVSVQSITR